MSRRGRKVSIPQAQLQAQRDDMGARVATLIDKYHTLHVLPLEIELYWHLEPWWKRLWLMVTGQRPDIDAIVEEHMDEINSRMIGPCPSTKHGAPCELQEGHEGSHRRRSFGDQVVEWEDDEADDAEAVAE